METVQRTRLGAVLASTRGLQADLAGELCVRRKTIKAWSFVACKRHPPLHHAIKIAQWLAARKLPAISIEALTGVPIPVGLRVRTPNDSDYSDPMFNPAALTPPGHVAGAVEANL